MDCWRFESNFPAIALKGSCITARRHSSKKFNAVVIISSWVSVIVFWQNKSQIYLDFDKVRLRFAVFSVEWCEEYELQFSKKSCKNLLFSLVMSVCGTSGPVRCKCYEVFA